MEGSMAILEDMLENIVLRPGRIMPPSKRPLLVHRLKVRAVPESLSTMLRKGNAM
jgi:hypothetical protein